MEHVVQDLRTLGDPRVRFRFMVGLAGELDYPRPKKRGEQSRAELV